MNIEAIDKISERLIGWGCVAAASVEFINPAILVLNESQAAGVGVFGFLLATGRAGLAVRRIGEMLRG